MIIIPAIDLINGKCVRLRKGNYKTARMVSENPIETALNFKKDGATWMHIGDLDGAKLGKPVNINVIKDIRNECQNISIEVGGGIRNMQVLDEYMNIGIDRVVLGTAAINDKKFISEAIEKYGEKVAVSIDSKEGMVAIEGWINTSDKSFITLTKEMEKLGVRTLIFTDISKNGMMSGPNLDELRLIKRNTSCNIIANGGIRDVSDIKSLSELDLFAIVLGKSLYEGSLNLKEAILFAKENYFNKFFLKSDLIPAIIQEKSTGEVLMMAYMNKESLQKTLMSGYTWFYSRSKNKLWNKGKKIGNTQKVVSIFADYDLDTLLITVEQKGSACDTGNHTCFYNEIWKL